MRFIILALALLPAVSFANEKVETLASGSYSLTQMTCADGSTLKRMMMYPFAMRVDSQNEMIVVYRDSANGENCVTGAKARYAMANSHIQIETTSLITQLYRCENSAFTSTVFDFDVSSDSEFLNLSKVDEAGEFCPAGSVVIYGFELSKPNNARQ